MAPNPTIKAPATSWAKHLLREFVLDPLLSGLAVALLLGGSYLLTIFLCGGGIR